MKKVIVLNLGNSFNGVMGDVREVYGDDIEVIVLALRRDEKPSEYHGQIEPPLLERTGAKEIARQVIFLDDESFDAIGIGKQIDTGVVLMNGGTSRGGLAAVRIYDGLRTGQLVNIQRDSADVMEQKVYPGT